MPSHKEHCLHSLSTYGKSFSILHKWMDEPVKVLGSSHRMFRHDLKKTPVIAKNLFGELADQACIDHIIMDFDSKKKKNDCFIQPYIKQKCL